MSKYEEQKHNLRLKLKEVCRPYPPLEEKPKAQSSPPLTAFESHRRNTDVKEAKKVTLAAVEEWDDIPSITPKLNAPCDEHVTTSMPLISFQDAFQYFKGSDLSPHMGNIQPSLERRGLSAVMNIFFGPPRLHASLEKERNIIFAIAQCQFDWEVPIHAQILQTIYKRLTNAKLDCPNYGNHWQDVGFQGIDPSTDVRGVGMLGILQFLYLVMSQDLEPLTRDIYKVARSENQNFPLAVMSINLTKVALDSLRKGLLNRKCNQRGSVINVLNEFYSAVFCHTFLVWTREQKTISDAGYILKDAERFCGQNVSKALRNLQEHLMSYKKSNGCVVASEPQPKRAKRCTNDADSEPATEFHNMMVSGAS